MLRCTKSSPTPPSTLKALGQIGGVGDIKLERYGHVFLQAIREQDQRH
jgi:superfamily II DNA helicase RecQ